MAGRVTILGGSIAETEAEGSERDFGEVYWFFWKEILDNSLAFEVGLNDVGLRRKSRVKVLLLSLEVGRSLIKSSARRFRGRGRDLRSSGKRSRGIGGNVTSGRLMSSRTSLMVKAALLEC